MKVLIALDGSETSERAAASLGKLATGGPVEVTLFTVFDAAHVHETADHMPTYVNTPLGAPSGSRLPISVQRAHLDEDRTQALERVHREHTEYLKGMSEKYFGGNAETLVEGADGHIAEVIVAAAKKTNADLIGVGSHGRSGISRALLGSVASDVVRHAHVPVVIAGPEA